MKSWEVLPASMSPVFGISERIFIIDLGIYKERFISGLEFIDPLLREFGVRLGVGDLLIWDQNASAVYVEPLDTGAVLISRVGWESNVIVASKIDGIEFSGPSSNVSEIYNQVGSRFINVWSSLQVRPDPWAFRIDGNAICAICKFGRCCLPSRELLFGNRLGFSELLLRKRQSALRQIVRSVRFIGVRNQEKNTKQFGPKLNFVVSVSLFIAGYLVAVWGWLGLY